jgi:hypothetical protein
VNDGPGYDKAAEVLRFGVVEWMWCEVQAPLLFQQLLSNAS